MITYQYYCNSCKTTFDVEQRITDKELTKCPVCGKIDCLTKVISGGLTTILKGDCWFKDGYK